MTKQKTRKSEAKTRISIMAQEAPKRYARHPEGTQESPRVFQGTPEGRPAYPQCHPKALKRPPQGNPGSTLPPRKPQGPEILKGRRGGKLDGGGRRRGFCLSKQTYLLLLGGGCGGEAEYTYASARLQGSWLVRLAWQEVTSDVCCRDFGCRRPPAVTPLQPWKPHGSPRGPLVDVTFGVLSGSGEHSIGACHLQSKCLLDYVLGMVLNVGGCGNEVIRVCGILYIDSWV